MQAKRCTKEGEELALQVRGHKELRVLQRGRNKHVGEDGEECGANNAARLRRAWQQQRMLLLLALALVVALVLMAQFLLFTVAVRRDKQMLHDADQVCRGAEQHIKVHSCWGGTAVTGTGPSGTHGGVDGVQDSLGHGRAPRLRRNAETESAHSRVQASGPGGASVQCSGLKEVGKHRGNALPELHTLGPSSSISAGGGGGGKRSCQAMEDRQHKVLKQAWWR